MAIEERHLRSLEMAISWLEMDYAMYNLKLSKLADYNRETIEMAKETESIDPAEIERWVKEDMKRREEIVKQLNMLKTHIETLEDLYEILEKGYE